MAVLLKLNDLLHDKVVPINPRLVSCEHILPRNAGKTRWTRDFRDAKGRYSGEAYAHRIGNLAILSRADNRRADTRPFEFKRAILKKSGHMLSKDAARESRWTADVIVERSERLVRMLTEHWRLGE